MVSLCTGMDAETDDNAFLMYPNPSEGILFMETGSEMKIKIFDKTGILIMEKFLSAGKHTLDTSNFSNGIYSIQSFTKQNVVIKSLVKVDY